MKRVFKHILLLSVSLFAVQMMTTAQITPDQPDNIEALDCSRYPTGDVWTIENYWSNSDGRVANNIIPMVGDLDGDNIPEIVCFGTPIIEYSKAQRDSVIRVFDGLTHTEKARIHVPQQVSGFDAAPYGLVKLTNRHGIIVVACYDLYLRAYDIQSATPNTPIWISDQPYGAANGDWATNVSFADIDNDGNPEILVRNKIYDATTGVLLAQATGGYNSGSSWAHRTEQTYTGWKLSSPIAADLLGDNRLEVILGNEIYEATITNHSGTTGNTLTLAKTIDPPSGVPSDGHAQVADFNLDGHLDILISIRNNYTSSAKVYLYVWDVHNNSVSSPQQINTIIAGKSIPLIADIDNDNILEVVIQCGQSTGYGFFAYKYRVASNDFSLMWNFSVDEDSYSNGATCFDFNQDGRMELLICDQSTMRIMNGSGKSHITGNDTAAIYAMSTLSYNEVTIMQYPVIADVDNDGHADIVSVGSNKLNLFRSADVPWAPARPVWNQYMYNITHVNRDLTIPQYLYSNATSFVDPEDPTIIRRPYNNFLQQATTIDENGRPFYGVADAIVSSATATLVDDNMNVSVTWTNQGIESFTGSVPYIVYANSTSGTVLASGTTAMGDATILPNDVSTTFIISINKDDLCDASASTLIVVVNANSTGVGQEAGLQSECDITNNKYPITIVPCAPDTIRVSHHACDYYDWEGAHFTTDTVATKILTSILTGNDSIVKLTLTIGHTSIASTIDTHSCGIFNWVEAEENTSTSDILQHTFSNITSCDSIVTLNVTIGAATADTITQTACDMYYWDLSDSEYTSSDNYPHLSPTPNASGCDSTIVLALTIKESKKKTDEKFACDSFYWEPTDSTYYLAANDTIFAHSTQGCDSLTILNLTMGHTSHADPIERDACDSMLWGSQMLHNSGEYSDTITNISGCDSLMTLSLTIRHSSLGDTTRLHVCDSFVWDRRGEKYFVANIYRDTTINNVGCDSIIFLNLTFSYSTIATPRSATACGQYEWTATGRTLTESNTYTDTLQSVAGCDSIIVLNLVILEIPQIALSGDTTIAICGTATMTANGAPYTIWGGSAITTQPTLVQGPASISLQPRSNVVLTATGYTLGEETVLNGDFSAGNTGFTTDLVYNSSVNAYGTYAVANYARGVHASFIGKDHTTPTLNTGNFMIIDGKDQANTMIWEQTVDVIPNSNYLFSMWGTSVTNSSPAQLQVYLNGTAVGSVFTVPSPATDQGNWGQHFFVWNSGDAMRGNIRIVNKNGASSGNDFGIDDISLRPLMCGVERRARIKVHIDTLQQSVCDAFTWRDNGLTYTESGNYTLSIRNHAGCDSLRVLALTVANNYIDTTIATACRRYFWHIDSTMYEESGLYRYTTNNGDSLCDTTLFLRLTIVDCNVPLPDNVDDPWCTAPPPADAFEMQELVECHGVNAMTTPMVGDVDGDGSPEVLAIAADSYSKILVFDGRDGTQKYTINTAGFNMAGQLMSIANVDGDSTAEFFLCDDNGRLHCYSATGTGEIWRSNVTIRGRHLVMTADVNGDGRAEVVCGPYIFDALTGTLLLQGTQVSTGQGYGAPHSAGGWGRVYYMQALVDIDFDGTLEFCAGNTIYKPTINNTEGTDGNTWQILRQAEVTGRINYYDGQTFLADFDYDGDVDVCVLGWAGDNHTIVYVWDGQTPELIAYYDAYMSGTYGGGMSPSIPFAGDLDGNGTPEIIFNHPDGMRAFTYCDTLPNKMRLMHFHRDFGETAGFTVFDFNQDGREEIVYRRTDKMYIVDGTDLSYLCSPLTTYSGTVCEYTLVADANGDGHANIVVCHAYQPWSSGNLTGKVSIFGSKRNGAWGSARKVWNQWAYSSVNINEDLTVPQHQFDLASIFPNGKEPFNGFLRQMPHLDQNGDIYMNTPNIDVTNAEFNTTYTDSSAVIRSSFCNYGDNKLEAPFYIAVYEDNYRGKLVDTFLIDTTAFIGSCIVEPLEIHMRVLCHLKCDSLAIAINDAGMGIAQNGGQQPECDTTNNVVKIPLQPVIPKADTLVVAQCDSFRWSAIDTMLIASSFISDTITDILGCDSVRWLKLTIFPSYYDTIDTIGCDRYTWNVTNETFTYDANTTKHFFSIHSCDSVHHLSLEMHYRYDTTENVHACQHYTWSVDHRTYNRTTTHTETMLTQYGCDSIRTLVVTIYQPYHDTIYDTICQGHTRTFGGITLTEEGHYQHKVPMMTDCDSIHDLFLSIRPLKPLEVTWTSQCELLQYTVTARNPKTDTIDDYFLWESFPPDEEADAQNRQQTIVVHPALATIYTAVSAYDKGLACPNKVSVSLTPTQPVKGHIRLSTNILSPELKEFRASAEGSGFNHQQWHIDGEPYSDNSTISYTYDPESNIDSVRIRLQVSNGYCFDSDSVVLRYYVGELFVPNFFAPSEERVGTFKVSGIGILDYEIHIYDRRGLLVFESEDIQEPWTGSLRSGEKAPQAAYVYTIRYRTAIAPDEWKIKTGSVVLLR